jgi:pantothenate kinase type III
MPTLFKLTDSGNSKTKSTYFHLERDCFIDEVESNADYFHIASTVNEEISADLDVAQLRKKNSFLEMELNYSTTLGIDRLVCAYALFPATEKLIVIDTGSFTTVDSIDDRSFYGGPILPGLELISSTYEKGAQLHAPQRLCTPNEIHTQSTAEAINQGYFYSTIIPLVEIIKRQEVGQVVLTGGASNEVQKLLKEQLNDISIHYKPNLLFEGLKKIAIRHFS